MADLNIPSTKIDDPNYRYKMPRPVAKIEGKGNGIRTNITNMKAIADALKRAPEYCTKFCGCELGTQQKYYEKDGKALVNGNHDIDQLLVVIDRFIEKFVLCTNCALPEVDLYVKGKMVRGHCNACGSEVDFDNSHKVASYIVKSQKGLADSSTVKEKKVKSVKDDRTEVTEVKEEISEKRKDPEELLGELKADLGDDTTDSAIDLAVKRMNLSHSLSDKESCLLTLELCFEDKPPGKLTMTKHLELIRKRASAMKASEFLEVFEKFVGHRHMDFFNKHAQALFVLYDNAVLTEEGILKYYRGSKQEKRALKSAAFREASEASKAFLDWLEDAESESDNGVSENEDIDEEDDDASITETNKAPTIQETERDVDEEVSASEAKRVDKNVVEEESEEEIDLDDI